MALYEIFILAMYLSFAIILLVLMGILSLNLIKKDNKKEKGKIWLLLGFCLFAWAVSAIDLIKIYFGIFSVQNPITFVLILCLILYFVLIMSLNFKILDKKLSILVLIFLSTLGIGEFCRFTPGMEFPCVYFGDLGGSIAVFLFYFLVVKFTIYLQKNKKLKKK